jgi:hypothetical protein
MIDGGGNNREKKMAEIPVEKKSGIPWWVWLLLALLLLALLWWLLTDDDEVEPVVVDDDAALIADPDDDGAPELTDAVDGNAITDLSLIASRADGSLEGRPVRLTGVRAGSVPEDAGFWLIPAEGGTDRDRVWVVLEEVLTPDTPIEGRVDVDEGDLVDVVGVMRRAESGAPEGAAIPGPTANLPDGIPHFIYASRVTQSGN